MKKGSKKTQSRSYVVQARRPAIKIPRKPIIAERDPQAVKAYESALKHFVKQEFAKAKEIFLKIVEEFPKETEIVERSRTHLNICQQRMARTGVAPKTTEDYYNLGIAFLNRREFDEAEAAFQKALASDPKGDHIYYGLASLEALRGQTAQALKHLQRAIQLNPNNRLTASKDPDLESLSLDAEFQELIRTPPPTHS